MNKKSGILILTVAIISIAELSFKKHQEPNSYISTYLQRLDKFKFCQEKLLETIEKSDLHSSNDIEQIKEQLQLARNNLKGLDFWFRYMEPIVYKKINGPLPVEWETEVFEKFEKPYKREGSGLSLAILYLNEEDANKDSLASLIKNSIAATETYGADSITSEFKFFSNFYLCNKLFLLNLAAIYTTGFECPDTNRIIPELRSMLDDVNEIYSSFNKNFPETALPGNYREIYNNAVDFVRAQPLAYTLFDHFSFIRNYII